jgi:hypothetical protein
MTTTTEEQLGCPQRLRGRVRGVSQAGRLCMCIVYSVRASQRPPERRSASVQRPYARAASPLANRRSESERPSDRTPILSTCPAMQSECGMWLASVSLIPKGRSEVHPGWFRGCARALAAATRGQEIRLVAKIERAADPMRCPNHSRHVALRCSRYDLMGLVGLSSRFLNRAPLS